MPGPLVIFGNPDAVTSETAAWVNVARQVESVLHTAQLNLDQHEKARLKAVVQLAAKMRSQVRAGIHENPGRRKRTKIGEHVQAIVYIHAKDGNPYVHGFGNAEIALKSIRPGDVRIQGLHDDTDVCMYGEPDGTVTIEGADGQSLWSMHKI